jgi:hypothetical protein
LRGIQSALEMYTSSVKVAAVGEPEADAVCSRKRSTIALHLDALADARDARAQAADAAHQQVDLDARLRAA